MRVSVLFPAMYLQQHLGTVQKSVFQNVVHRVVYLKYLFKSHVRWRGIEHVTFSSPNPLLTYLEPGRYELDYPVGGFPVTELDLTVETVTEIDFL